MESLTRNVADLDSAERQVFERVLGRQLENNQRVFLQISVVDVQRSPVATAHPPVADDSVLPESYRLFKGLSDAEVAELETEILQRSESRPN